jgi:hypothetical protein
VTETPVEEGVKYEYDEYTLKCGASPTLERRVHENYDAWLTKAKEAEQSAYVPSQEDRLAALEAGLLEVILNG